MKRNISINISGIIFNVEEDGYKVLQEYLNAITKFFSSYEDSREIIEDIEVRIAEIFYSRLDKQKQVITLEDVEDLMVTMGSIDDFQSAEEDPAYQTTFEDYGLNIPTEDDFRNGGNTAIQVTKPNPIEIPEELIETEREREKEYAFESEPIYAQTQNTYEQEAILEENIRKLYRDTQRKVLGGVAAGVAHYLQIDPIWVRLLFIFLITGLFFVPAGPSIMIVYIIMWSVIPKNDHLEENPRVKKLFRNSDKGVLGGVAAGLASYLGVNEMTVRIVFLIFGIVFGSGIFIYGILWLIIPEAKTLTEKMQMEGQAINLSNIQSAIRDKIGEDLELDNSRFNKILLFPFRLLAVVLRHAAQFLRPIVSFTAETVRIGGGLVLILISTVLTLSWVAVLMGFLGWGWDKAIDINSIPAEVIRNSFDLNPIMIINAFVTVFIPSLFIGMLGVMMMRRQVIWNRKFGWSALALWLLSLVGTGVTIGMNARQFSHYNEFVESATFNLPQKSLNAATIVNSASNEETSSAQLDNVLTIDLVRNQDGNFRKPTLTIRGYDGDEIKLEKKFRSQGINYAEANENAQMINYNIEQQDNVLIFDEQMSFKPHAKYRHQRLQLNLEIPYGIPFRMSPNILNILRNTLYPHNYHAKDVTDETIWQFTSERLICISCEEQKQFTENDEQFNGSSYVYAMDDFSELEVVGNYDVRIIKGEESQVEFFNKEDTRNVKLNNSDNNLYISPKNNPKEPIKLRITTPYLETISLRGATKAKAAFFKQSNLEIDLAGSSALMIEGEVQYLETQIKGNSTLSAFKLKARQVEIQASGNGEAQLQVGRELEAQASGNGTIIYRGNPRRVQGESSGNGTINRE